MAIFPLIRQLPIFLYQKIFFKPKNRKGLVSNFNKFYYDSLVWKKTFWLGIPVKKCPLDLWVYSEILHEIKPDVLIETGTADGGSALFLAHVCDSVGKGKIITIDTVKKIRPKHRRIKYLTGSSVSDEIVKKVKSLIRDKDKVVVILDSDHGKNHVLKELEIYNKFVTKGSYLIVEDTNLNGHPVFPGFGPGPMEAIDEFLSSNKDFSIDRRREKFYLTFNPRGVLRKVK